MSPTAGHATERCDPVIRTGFPLQPGLAIHQGLSQMRSRRARRLPARRAVRTTSARFLSLAPMQLGLHTDDLVDYAARKETRHEHLAELRTLYSFRTFSGRCAQTEGWLFREAEAMSNEDIARRFVADCRRTRTVPRYRL